MLRLNEHLISFAKKIYLTAGLRVQRSALVTFSIRAFKNGSENAGEDLLNFKLSAFRGLCHCAVLGHTSGESVSVDFTLVSSCNPNTCS